MTRDGISGFETSEMTRETCLDSKPRGPMADLLLRFHSFDSY
jgi:hypothetical protein